MTTMLFLILLLAPSSSSFPSFRDPSIPMRLVVVHNATMGGGEVFVAGRNILYRFDRDLKLEAKWSTGPRMDHPSCPHPDHPCTVNGSEVVRKPTDDDPRLLQIVVGASDPTTPLLLWCGTLYRGACRVRPLAGGRGSVWVGPFSAPEGEVGSREGTASFVQQQQEGGGSGSVLWSASTFDGGGGGPAVAARRLVRGGEEEGGGFRLEYASATEAHFTGLNFDAKYRRNYPVEYVHAFEHGGFAYFVQRQKVSPESELHETRLGRVCEGDPAFFSYSELPLRCHYGLEAHAIGTAAALGRAGDLLGRRLRLDAQAAVLYAAFGKATPGHGDLVDESRGSVICSFPMATVEEAFENATRDCFRAEARTSLLRHVTGIDIPCRREEEEVGGVELCGSGLNHYVGARESLPGGFRAHVPARVTALAAALQGGKPVALAATDTGLLYKLQLDRRDEQVLFVRDIGGGAAVEANHALDPPKDNVYFLAGDKVVKFPIGSCSVYAACGECLGTRDPLGCGWCGHKCAHLDECDTPDAFSTDTCPPTVRQVSPLSGPTEGGTVLTISGDNFGTSHSGEMTSSLTVVAAGKECHVTLWEKERIECKTSPGSEGDSGPVTVNVTDLSWTHGEYDEKGTAHGQLNFTYVVPRLFGVWPGKGPVSGGTNVTVRGSRMDAGSRRTLTLAGVPCEASSFRGDEGWCVSGGNRSRVGAGQVLLLMDDAILEVDARPPPPLDALFEYRPDPAVRTLTPHATTLGGYVSVTVTGEHLDSVSRPVMVVTAASTLTGERTEFHEECAVEAGGLSMTCPTPSLLGGGLPPPSARAPLVTHLSFAMDGAPRLLQESAQMLYYPDPEWEEMGHVTTTRDAAHLEIKGRFLDLALSPDDIRVTVGGDNVCNVTYLTQDHLLCLLPASLLLMANNASSSYDVEVWVGRGARRRLGSVSFVSGSWGGATIGAVCAAVLTPCLFAALAFLHCRRVARKRKSRHPGYIVAYTAEQQQTDPRDAHCGAGRQDSSGNDYQQCGGATSAKQHTSAKQCVEAESGVEEERRRLLEGVLLRREQLTLGDVIGVGHFGCVYKGVLLRTEGGGGEEVAVKTLLHNSSPSDVDNFLQEGLTMRDLPPHPNVLSLVGVVCPPAHQPPMVVLPYCEHGDLLAYIRDERNSPTVRDLLSFGVQIAAGMRHLAEMKIVHRDLAARNCMLSSGLCVKVADFGLSRDVYERDYYSSDNKKQKLPVKWMAPESLEKGTYSTRTDVWSFGVVLWELVTRGVGPYPDVDNWDVIHYLKQGRRMPQPAYCPDALYAVMLECWREEGAGPRPSFAELESRVKGVMQGQQKGAGPVGLHVTYVNCPTPTGHASS